MSKGMPSYLAAELAQACHHSEKRMHVSRLSYVKLLLVITTPIFSDFGQGGPLSLWCTSICPALH